jgi:phosphate/sulfate permease
MIFALLIAAIVWNLGTSAMGIPNSSSHALIRSIMGGGVASEMMASSGQATSGIDWSQAVNVGEALFSPLVGFVLRPPLNHWTGSNVTLSVIFFKVFDRGHFLSFEFTPKK